MRFIKRVQPSNMKPEFLNDDIIEIDLPNQIIDLSTLNIYYEANADPVQKYSNGKYLKRFVPRLSQSIIQELTVFVDNRVVQEIKEFNYLFNILHDGMNEFDEIDGDKHDSFNYYEISKENRVQKVRDIDGSVLHTYKYFIDKFLGFLNDVKVLDCRNKNIKIRIKLAPKWITYRGIEGGDLVETQLHFDDYKYRIKNVSANIDIISPDEYVAVEKDVSFEDFRYVKGLLETDKNTQLSLQHKGNINYILSTFMDADRETDSGLQFTGANEDEQKFGTKDYFVSVDSNKTKTSEYMLNNSLYFKRNGLNIKNCIYRLNGQDITPLMSMTEMYNVAKKFFGGMKRVKSITSFQNDFFCFPINIGKVPDDMISEIEFSVISSKNNPNGGTGIMYISYDKSYKL